jgi:hypothetical protein
MFKWYQNATKCYVYLTDVSIPWASAFPGSKWFSRGWTLQELIAPQFVEFYSKEGERLGDKTLLAPQLQEITGIPIHALRGEPLSHFGDEERISWAVKRTTKCVARVDN